VVPSHEVFRKPLKVALQFEDHDVPAGYRRWPGGENLGSTIKVWKVQTRKFPEIDPGLVSDPYGFADSPDAEVISSGLNSKGPDSVALGRHGNFFLWGFAASPKDMTPEARKCFVNAVCYIRKFEGRRPVIKKEARGREWALLNAGLAEQYFDAEFFKRSVPEELRRRFGKDSAKYLRYYTENLEYLRPSGDGYAVDEDVKGLGLSNRKVELLDACASMLERNDRPELARRILERYTTRRFAEAAGWRSWLEEKRPGLFFTDTGGFKFLAVPASLIGPAGTGEAGRLADDEPPRPDARHPVTARAELAPTAVRPGQEAVFIVRVETAPSWHIYAVEGSNGPGIATTLRLKLPRGVEAEGEWSCPKPIKTSDDQMAYEGRLEFRRKLKVRADAAPGPIEVACELGYMACDPHSCRPPTKDDLVARAEVVGATPGR
jgi:Disulphide bond corrector protein DsbC